jgi:hypothetical protein
MYGAKCSGGYVHCSDLGRDHFDWAIIWIGSDIVPPAHYPDDRYHMDWQCDCTACRKETNMFEPKLEQKRLDKEKGTSELEPIFELDSIFELSSIVLH